MAFHVRHRYGGNDSNPPLESLDELLDEVEADPSDHDHVGVGVVHESGWCVGVGAGWTIYLENVEDREIAPRHINVGRDRARALHLMRAAAAGDLAALEAEPWQPGYE
jgi:hypothetical protein